MSDLFFEPAEPDCDAIHISVIGVGGCGGNTVNLLAEAALPPHVNIVAMNTDAKAQQQSRCNWARASPAAWAPGPRPKWAAAPPKRAWPRSATS